MKSFKEIKNQNMPRKQLFGYTKVRRYKDGHLVEELCDVVLGCITSGPRKEVVDEIKKGNFTLLKKSEKYDILEVPLYD